MPPFTSTWASEQNSRTRAWFEQPDHHPLRKSIRRRLNQLSVPSEPVHSVPSPDGRWKAWAITDPATDLQCWQVGRVGEKDGSDEPDGAAEPSEQLQDVFPSGIAWLPDGAGWNPGFFYDRSLPFLGGHGLYFHALGTAQRDDTCLLHHPEHPDWYYQPSVSPDGHWLAVSILNGSANNRLTLISLVSRTDSPTYELIPYFVGRYDIVHWRESELICRAVEPNAPNGQLIAFDLSGPQDGPPTRRVVLPPGALPLLDAVPFANGWVVSYLDGGAAALHLHDGQGEVRQIIPLPGLGTIGWLEAVQPPEVRLLPKVELLKSLRFAYTDFAHPAQTYTWRPGDSEPLPEGEASPPVFDPTHFVTRFIRVVIKSAASVPLFLAHRRNVTPIDSPTLLTAYGGLGYALTPRFSADALAWMERGGVYAIVCARGGGELGASWHQAAVGAAKQRTFDDVLSIAQWLVGAGITTPARLGLWGTSNGGLTAGACLTQRPELFGAVVIESGLLDMLDYHRLGRGQDWIVEYGNPDNPAQRTVLAAYSPLHNIQPGRLYPATLITTSDNDPRVGESHSLRFAQSLQNAQSGDAPVLLRVDPGGGHGDQPTAAQWLDRTADRLTFFAIHLGLA